jgi:hypothetical protein
MEIMSFLQLFFISFSSVADVIRIVIFGIKISATVMVCN